MRNKHNYTMPVLLIDNETILLEKLKKLIPGREVIRAWDDLEGVTPNNYSLIILSGGSKFPVVGNEEALFSEMSLVQNAETPIIGICYGCEVIVRSSGGTLELMSEKERGIITIDIVEHDPIFNDKGALQVYESHRWRIKELPEHYVALAHSKHGIEAIRHTKRPIYGFQFHPEQCVNETDGDEIFMTLFQKLIRI